MEMAVGTVSVAAGVVGVMVKVMVVMVTVAEVIYLLLRRQLFCLLTNLRDFKRFA